VALAINDLASYRDERGDVAGTEMLLRQSLDIFRRLPTRVLDEAATEVNLGITRRLQRDYDESERLLAHSQVSLEALVGPDHPRVAKALQHRAETALRRGDTAQARAFIDRARAIQRRMLPDGHFETIMTMRVEGEILTAQGELGRAERELRRSLAIAVRSLPKGHRQIAIVQGALGGCLVEQQRYEEAEPLLRESLRDLEASVGGGHPQTTDVRARLERLQATRSRRTDALANP
jgi:tetratricopeptide (TPR) repeat protein